VTDSPRSENGPSGETIDIVADARQWLADTADARLQTHSAICHRWHPTCLIVRLADAVERLRMTPEESGLMRVAATLCVLRGAPKTAAGLGKIADRLGGDK
jgi:hypothetical protein